MLQALFPTLLSLTLGQLKALPVEVRDAIGGLAASLSLSQEADRNQVIAYFVPCFPEKSPDGRNGVLGLAALELLDLGPQMRKLRPQVSVPPPLREFFQAVLDRLRPDQPWRFAVGRLIEYALLSLVWKYSWLAHVISFAATAAPA